MSFPTFPGQGGGCREWSGRGKGEAGTQLWRRGFLSLQNDVEKVVVVILDKEHRPVEKFVFEITQPPLLSIRCAALFPIHRLPSNTPTLTPLRQPPNALLRAREDTW